MSTEPTDATPLKPLKPESGDAPAPAEEGKEVEDVPPKYESLLGITKMKKAVEKSPNKAGGACKVFEILTGSGISLVCLLIYSALPIAMIVIGSIYLRSCPGQRLIPIWLIVFGCFSLFQTLVNTCRTICSSCSKDDEEGGNGSQYASRGGGCCECLILTFLIAWFIAGNVWVFRFQAQFYSPGCQANLTLVPIELLTECCAAVPYLFSFWSIIAIYALSVLSCIVFCTCFCCCACILGIVGAASSAA